MDSIKVNICDKLNSASALTREQGKKIYDIISPALLNNEKVILDFSGIENIITPFLNVAIGKLYENNSSSKLKNLLVIVNQPTGTNAKINLVIENAKKYYQNTTAFNAAKEEVLSSDEK